MKNLLTDSHIRVALVGCGQHMNEVLYPMLRMQPGISVVAVTSRSQVSAKLFAEKWGIQKVVPKWQDYFNGQIDAIIGSGPVQLHEELALACSEKEIPLFVEKPIARNLACLQSIIAKQRIRPVPLQVGYNLRFSASVQAFKEAVASSSVNRLEISYHVNKPKSPLWGLDSLINSFLLAIAVHPLSAACHIFGNIIRVLEVNMRAQGEDVSIEVQLEHEGNKVSKVIMSNLASRFELSMNAFVDQKLIINLPNLFLVSKINEKGEPIDSIYKQSPLKPINLSSGYSQQFDKFFSDVRQPKQPIITDVEQSIWMYELFESILKEASQ